MKKNKILIVIICILVCLVLVFGGILLFKDNKDNKDNTSKTDNPTTSDEINEVNNDFVVDIISIAKKSDDKIYALTYSGNEVELMDVSKYNGGVVYTYYNGKLYLYLYKYTSGKTNVETGEVIQESKDYNTLGYIDLTADNYNFTKLSDVTTIGRPESIAIVDNIIYFSSSAFDGIYKYNIDTKKFTTTNEFNFNRKTNIQLYTISNSKLAYLISGITNEPSSIGIIDIKTGSKKEIVSNVKFEYVYNGKIIYAQYDDINNYSKWKYYEYNIKDDSFKQISDSTSSVTSIYNSFIIPFDDYYIYVNKNTLNKYSNGKNEKIYEFDGSINSINLVSSNKLNVVYGSGMNTKAKCSIFDLNSLTLSNQNDISYSQVLYLK